MIVALAHYEIDDVITLEDQVGDCCDHAIMPLATFTGVHSRDCKEHSLIFDSHASTQRRAIAWHEPVPNRVWHDDNALGRDLAQPTTQARV